MTERTQLEDIERIVYWWARYEGERKMGKPGKVYSKGDIDELIVRLKRYRNYPEKFNFDYGEVPEEEITEEQGATKWTGFFSMF